MRIDTSKLLITYKKIADLKINPHNSRTHSKRQVRQIADSIKAFGFASPVLLDRSNTIVAGHGRVDAAKLLGMCEVPTIRLENLSPDQVRAYALADNRLAELAGWDPAILAIELQNLLTIDSDFDVTITGFEIPEIDILLAAKDDNPDLNDDFHIDETLEAVTCPNDLWLLGKHRILCGNSLDTSSHKTLMGNRQASLVFTDPPYNVPVEGNICGKGSIHHREFSMGSGEMSEAEFVAFLTTSFRLLARDSVKGSVHFICIDWRHVGELLAAAKQIYESLLNICIWVKNNGGMGSLYRSQHELILVFRHGKEPHRNNVKLGKFGRNRTNVWQYPGASTFSKQGEEGNLLALHPTVKPVALVADAFLDCSSRGDIVLDSFLGSGSTLIAAERVGRVCYGIEIDPLYVDVTIRRWQKLTGEHAIHSATGTTFDDIAALKGDSND